MAAEDVNIAFFNALDEGVVEEVGAYLDEDCRLLEFRFPGGGTPLILAAGCGYAEVVTLLLGRGADIYASDDNGETALFRAVGHAHEEVLDILLAFGADANMACLVLAVARGVPGVLRRLLRSLDEEGLNAQRPGGATAFYLACLMGHVEMARILLLEGADHTIATTLGATPRMAASFEGNDACVALIDVSSPSDDWCVVAPYYIFLNLVINVSCADP